ncbi:MAG: DUF1080 domain-containing protein [Pedosphaera sp.]|nr:DUF1080 domain-containing protein [Pedosphaera sp.]MSU44315.1 DUF1080 domain-containing protein [Pedosphaera sp.]
MSPRAARKLFDEIGAGSVSSSVKSIFSIILLCAATLAVSSQTVCAAEEKEEGFAPLFNGKNFDGWRFTGAAKSPANWKVAEGVIQLSGGGSPHLSTANEYGDFELRLEWRAKGDKYNSGLYLRSGPNLGSNQLNLAKGSEGGLVGGKVEGAKAVPALQKPAGEWNEWRVRAVGDKVTFWCNGKLAWEGTGLKPARGHIGMQAEGAAMEFRNVRLKEIK